MNANECNQRASRCAENAAIAVDESISLEFLKLAAQWRAMAVRNIFIGHVADPEALGVVPAFRRLAQISSTPSS